MKIAIIGPGAIGRLLGYALAAGGHEVVMICRREEQAERFWQDGVIYVDPDGQEHRATVQAAVGMSDDACTGLDGVLVTVKSYDTAAAARQIAAVTTDAPVLSLQNGLGNAETLARHLDPGRIALALTTHGATAEGDSKVWHKGRGQTVIGSLAEHSTTACLWADLLTACGHSAQLSDDIRREVWSKAMVNIGINPFTAVLGVQNGQLLQEPEILPLMQAAVAEAERAALADGIVLEDSFLRVLEVCRNTADNTSSMLQDLQKGRRTEIEAMCGVVVEIAEQSGFPAPYNFFLKKIVKKCETKRLELSSLEVKGLFEQFFHKNLMDI
ncbi:ketopantoate reductase [Tumebacillus sp. BK434]|uniref:ketopantoate reductase family protein n=1 Tax=Tumebacillus sp. BK434 TaxID=2512169 RepID=UPI00104D5BD0|nr:2-dehydropantoate 2-reductase [Tumebacillus sp. BK434]TCP52913.1 ketopantoate reductase [Tumebacillus sp. BK434]